MPVRRKIQGRILIHAIPAFTPSGPAELLKIIPDNFLAFRACVAMDGAGRATQDAKAEMHIKSGSVKAVILLNISN